MSRNTEVIDYTVPADIVIGPDYPVLDLGGKSIVGILWPTALTSTSVNFRAAYFSGEFPRIAPGGSIFAETAVPGDLWLLSITEVRNFRVLQSLIITTGATETADRLFSVLARHVG